MPLPTKLWPCPGCRRSTFGYFLCADCVERARVHRCAELAGARTQKVEPGVTSPRAPLHDSVGTAGETVAPAPRPVEHSRPVRAASSKYVSVVTDGRTIVGPGRRCGPCSVASAAELAELVRDRVAGDELAVFIHPAAHRLWDLPAHDDGTGVAPGFFADVRRVGASYVADGARPVHFMLPAHTGDFADADTAVQLLAATERFRDAVGMSYLFSGPSTIHRLIKVVGRVRAAPPAEPELDDYAAAAYATPAYAWSRPLAGPERDGGGWVRAFDRSGSYLAAWRGLYLSDGPWSPTSGPAGPGPESSRPPGYWLVGEAPRAAVAGAAAALGLPDPLARWGDAEGPCWVTTPLLQLAVELAGPFELETGWVTAGRCRALDGPAARLGEARDVLGAGPHPEDRLALDVLKTAYAGATAWLEYGPGSGPLHRPHWRRTVIDRHVANTFRGLARAATPPLALTAVDCALFVLGAPDEAPAGLRLGTGLGAWKPKGRAVPLGEATDALGAGGVRAVMRLIEGAGGGDRL